VALTGNLRLTAKLSYNKPGEATRKDTMFASVGLQATFQTNSFRGMPVPASITVWHSLSEPANFLAERV
jgi:hypothetical protein